MTTSSCFRGQKLPAMLRTAAGMRIHSSWDFETTRTVIALRSLARRACALGEEAAEHETAILRIVTSWRPARKVRHEPQSLRRPCCVPGPSACQDHGPLLLRAKQYLREPRPVTASSGPETGNEPHLQASGQPHGGRPARHRTESGPAPALTESRLRGDGPESRSRRTGELRGHSSGVHQLPMNKRRMRYLTWGDRYEN